MGMEEYWPREENFFHLATDMQGNIHPPLAKRVTRLEIRRPVLKPWRTFRDGVVISPQQIERRGYEQHLRVGNFSENGKTPDPETPGATSASFCVVY